MLHEALLIKWKPSVLDVVKPYILINILFKTRFCTKLIPPISLVLLVGLLQYVSTSVAEKESNHKDTQKLRPQSHTKIDIYGSGIGGNAAQKQGNEIANRFVVTGLLSKIC
jgi:hypothetical protein